MAAPVTRNATFGLKAVKIGEVRNQCRYWG
jgi:hypothetical protein